VLGPIGADAPLEDVVEIQRLVSAMKPTNSKVDNCWAQMITRVRRRGDLA